MTLQPPTRLAIMATFASAGMTFGITGVSCPLIAQILPARYHWSAAYSLPRNCCCLQRSPLLLGALLRIRLTAWVLCGQTISTSLQCYRGSSPYQSQSLTLCSPPNQFFEGTNSASLRHHTVHTHHEFTLHAICLSQYQRHLINGHTSVQLAVLNSSSEVCHPHTLTLTQTLSLQHSNILALTHSEREFVVDLLMNASCISLY